MLDFAKWTSELSRKRRRDTALLTDALTDPSTFADPSPLTALTDPSPLTDSAPTPLPASKRTRLAAETETPPPPPNAAAAEQQMRELQDSIAATSHLFALPTHTEDLGRFPVYEAFEDYFQMTGETTGSLASGGASDDSLLQPSPFSSGSELELELNLDGLGALDGKSVGGYELRDWSAYQGTL
ncbi:hypothetical protein C8R46DRAFT_1117178 [Mycena filopes]|nr:hypothetical protein C8R46DRAFT_1117178 [Mycena filopes]